MALINLRNALMAGKRLPYDAELEFLESTGTQYIDTGLNYFADFEIGVKLRASVPNKALGTGAFMCLERYSSSNPYWSLNVNGRGYDSVALIVDYHVMTWKDGVFAADGVTLRTVSNPFASGTMTLFGAGGQAFPNMIYACKLWDANGVLVRDYIPVRKGTVGYFYDRVSGKLFGNAGTGDFVLGQDVVPVEYIESHGTEWIDTGLLGRDGYDFEYRFRPLNPLPCGIGGEFESYRNCYIGLVRSNGYLAYHYHGPDTIVQVQSLTLGTDYDVKSHLYSGEQYFEVNGVRGGVGSRTGTFTSSYNLYLFAINSANRPTNFGVMRLYGLTAHLNTTLVRSFRPVRVGTNATSWEGAMMDVLTRRIYRNAGTGAFGYGNDLKYPIPAE